MSLSIEQTKNLVKSFFSDFERYVKDLLEKSYQEI